MTPMTSIKRSLDKLKIACVYDWFDSKGGAERVLPTIAHMFPHADWYSSIVQKNYSLGLKVTPSFIQNLPYLRSHRLAAMPLYPVAFESFDFTGYDLVLSITSSFAKGVITRPETTHICYMLTPTRFLWGLDEHYTSPLTKSLFKPYISYLKKWDLCAAERPDHYIAISQTVADRIQEYYKKDASVIYPPFSIPYWEEQLRRAEPPAKPLADGYYIVVSRLTKYKCVDLVVRAFNKLRHRQLVIVGSGSEKSHLQSMASENIHFLENVTDKQLAFLYAHAKGCIMPQEEDFGYTSLEAQLCSCPVIAFNKGGARETVKHLKTGFLFDEQTPHGIILALESFEGVSATIDHHLQAYGSHIVEPFSESLFIEAFIKKIQSLI